MIAQEATSRSRNLSVAWIDYQKAYDRVPHGWLELVLNASNSQVFRQVPNPFVEERIHGANRCKYC